MDKKNESFKPYISADKVLPEFTVTSILMGIILAVVFGAANAYLGLKVGMTVSASIPAAVISLGVIRVIMKKNSILESNMVQTIGSAGESLAAGAIFTMPALFLWAEEGKIDMPGYLKASVRKAGKTVKDEIAATAPKDTGKYAKSWAVKTQKETSNSLALVVHSKNRYQLAHLLEFGHAKRGGGRVAARPHITPAEEKAIDTLEREIEKALKG